MGERCGPIGIDAGEMDEAMVLFVTDRRVAGGGVPFDSLRIAIGLVDRRVAIGAQNRRDEGVGDANQSPALFDRIEGDPIAGIAFRQQPRARPGAQS